MTLLRGTFERPRLRQDCSHIDRLLWSCALSSSKAASPSREHSQHCQILCNASERNHRCRPERGRRRIGMVSLALSMPLTGGPNFKALLSNEPSASGGLSQDQTGHTEQTNSASIDPQASGENIVVIHSPQELDELLEANPTKLVCMMCKAIGCRPCKVFARKYQRIAAAYQGCIFLECTGDETIDLRKLMIQMGIRSTPTFRLYRGGECVKTHVGIDDIKLKAALDSCLEEGEAAPTA